MSAASDKSWALLTTLQSAVPPSGEYPWDLILSLTADVASLTQPLSDAAWEISKKPTAMLWIGVADSAELDVALDAAGNLPQTIDKQFGAKYRKLAKAAKAAGKVTVAVPTLQQDLKVALRTIRETGERFEKVASAEPWFASVWGAETVLKALASISTTEQKLLDYAKTAYGMAKAGYEGAKNAMGIISWMLSPFGLVVMGGAYLVLTRRGQR